MTTPYKKKLIEVAIPLEVINAAFWCARRITEGLRTAQGIERS